MPVAEKQEFRMILKSCADINYCNSLNISILPPPPHTQCGQSADLEINTAFFGVANFFATFAKKASAMMFCASWQSNFNRSIFN